MDVLLDGGQAQWRGLYHPWTGKINGKTVTRRLTETEADLYQEWITNDRTLRALIAEMPQVAAQATELIMQNALIASSDGRGVAPARPLDGCARFAPRVGQVF